MHTADAPSRTYWMSAAPGAAFSSGVRARAQGYEPGLARFTGTVDDLSVGDWIQMLQLLGKSAVITVRRNGMGSRLWCADGSITDAESGRLRGEAAVYRMIGFERGCLHVELRSVTRARTVFGPSQQLLLEALRRKDESAVLRRELGDEDCRYRSATSPEGVQNASEQRLLQSLGSAPRLGDVLEQSELGEFETLATLARWLRAGYIVRASAPDDAREGPRRDAAEEEAVSLIPLVASPNPSPRPPVERARHLSLWVVLAFLLLMPGAYFWGAQRTRASAVAAARAAARPASTETPPRAPETFGIELYVEPNHAQIWLDDERVAVGYLQTTAPRDGVAHELMVAAPGFAPAKIFFVDAAPPSRVRLEALAPASAAPASAAPAPARPPLRRAVARTRRRSRPPQASLGPAAMKPRVQLIGEEPHVRVLD